MTETTSIEISKVPAINKIKSPSLLKILLESRTILEASSFALSFPLLQTAAKGDKHPVLVLPGFLAGDFSTKLLRTFLKSRNFTAYKWDLGRNLGKQSNPQTGVGQVIIDRLVEIYEKHGQKVSIVGWSLGGIYARELARLHPEMVRQVISLGSPFSKTLKANHAVKLFERTSGHKISEMTDSFVHNMHIAPPVPCTAVFSKTDGITAWQCCLERPSETAQNIEVFSSHCGLGHHPFVMWLIADRLSQKEDQWQRFVPSYLEKAMFRCKELSIN